MVRVDSLVQGAGLVVVSVGLTWALALALLDLSPASAADRQAARAFALYHRADPAAFSQRTPCRLRAARLQAAAPSTLLLEALPPPSQKMKKNGATRYSPKLRFLFFLKKKH